MKNNSKPTVTIGIPAFNEQGNIGLLLNDLLKQKVKDYVLEKIVVVSDGSTDNTAGIVRKYKNKKIVLIDNKKNKGLAKTQNEIMGFTSSDILVLINGDVSVKNSKFIERLIRPIVQAEAELTSPRLLAEEPRTFFESVLIVGANLRKILFTSWRDGQNGYLCHGGARAFSRKYYPRLRFKDAGGEDMYSYLKCLSLGFRFTYVKDAVAFLRLPRNFKDHYKQSVRFFKYQRKLSHEFKKDLVNRELNIPISAVVKGAFRAIPTVLAHPFRVVGYVFIVTFMKVKSYFLNSSENLWNATSTKII